MFETLTRPVRVAFPTRNVFAKLKKDYQVKKVYLDYADRKVFLVKLVPKVQVVLWVRKEMEALLEAWEKKDTE